ncbi:MAG: TRAM domain-containing protein [bacterium]
MSKHRESASIKVGQEIVVKVVDLAFGGEGVGRYEGAAVFVPFAAVGDLLRVRIVQDRKSFYRASLVEIVEPSADRVAPPCPYYARCGGCQYQHISYEAELAAKGKQLRDVLERVGKIGGADVRPILHAAPYGYRNRITVHNEKGRIGFRAVDGREIVDVEECLLATAEVNQKLKKLREKPRPRPHYSVRADAVAGEAFYQTNELLMPALPKLVRDALSANIEAVVEGYAGAGFFTRVLAEKVKQVVSIESDPKAIRERRAPSHVIWLEGTFEEFLPEARNKIKSDNVACFVDPPREGLSEIARRDLLSLPFRQLLYLSCNPAALARDVRALEEKWKPVYFQPIDLFPRTAHVECLAVLEPR